MISYNDTTGCAVDRRAFIKNSGALLGGSALLASARIDSASAAQSASANSDLFVPDGATVLFQGDSITDAGWDRSKGQTPNKQEALGNGYAWLAAANLLTTRPDGNLRVFNRGISGNKVFQLAERWDRDCLDLKPDVLSILIGVNDIWHTLNGNYKGTVEVYDRDYRALLERTKKVLPKVKLVICEPFVLRCGAVNDKWFPEFNQYRAAAKRVAEAFDARFVPLHSIFETATQYAAPEHWAKDGVHPSPAGAALMAHHWLRTATS